MVLDWFQLNRSPGLGSNLDGSPTVSLGLPPPGCPVSMLVKKPCPATPPPERCFMLR